MIEIVGFRKEVIGPFSGQKFSIRRVRFKEFITTIGGLPLPISSTVQEVLGQLKEKTQAGDIETEDRITRFYVSKGIVEPKIWFDAGQDCPSDCIYYEDLGSDLDYLAGEIIQFSHEMAGLKEMEKFFRESGAGAPGPNGQAVWTEAIEPVASTDS